MKINVVSPKLSAIWSDWSNWSACSKDCDGGTQTRNRRCSENGQCSGKNSEIQKCNTHFCGNYDQITIMFNL